MFFFVLRYYTAYSFVVWVSVVESNVSWCLSCCNCPCDWTKHSFPCYEGCCIILPVAVHWKVPQYIHSIVSPLLCPSTGLLLEGIPRHHKYLHFIILNTTTVNVYLCWGHGWAQRVLSHLCLRWWSRGRNVQRCVCTRWQRQNLTVVLQHWFGQ